ncbi:MAG: Glu-tRNA(Gln) amidotransferase subunit GatD [Candidatus Bathyarchaeota archaeon]|jgi:glutamyl-tRNA(Gln) amidotransferase subunit D
MKKKDDFPGYRGEALQSIKDAGATIGDMIRVTRGEQTYEGILIPRSEGADEKHLVLKLKSGYNVGVKITEETKIKRISKAASPSFVAPPLPKQNPELKSVVILSTGGTIASRVDYRTGAVRPALTARDLNSVVPELTNIAKIETEILLNLFSENITPKHWTQIAKAVAKKILAGVDGVVIAHGTDTMGYTAAALSFALQNLPVPVILVGSQRSADRPSSDAATNLIGAVTAATKAPFAEVAIAMHETTKDTSIILHKGTKTRKCHTSKRDAFKSVNITPLARIEDGKITMITEEYQKRLPTRRLKLKPQFNERVALLKFYPALNPEIINFYIKHNYKGIILEGTGLGHVSSESFKAIKKAVEKDIIVGMTSQCIWGRINMNVYNQGRDLQNIGITPLEDILPETALVKLMWVLGQTTNIEEAQKLLKQNISGEFSPRTLPEEDTSV